MARKKKAVAAVAAVESEPVAESPESAPAGPERVEGLSLQADSASSAERKESPKERIVVTLDDSGGLDLGSMREKTRGRLVEAINRSSRDLFPEVPKGPVFRLPDAAIQGLYAALGAAEMYILGRKYPPEIAAEVFQYSREEIEILSEPTQAVLSKYGGKVLTRFQEEAALLLALAGIHVQKFERLERMMELRQMAERKEAA